MSELNEDILNYEIGDVDDTDLTGADEDELLLSDDESISGRLVPHVDEDELLLCEPTVNKQLPPATVKQPEVQKPATVKQPEVQIPTESSSSNFQTVIIAESVSVNKIECSNDIQESSSTTKANENVSSVKQVPQKCPSVSPESDLVTSTNKEDEELSSQPTQSEHRDSDPSFGSDEKSESYTNDDSEVSYSQSEQTDCKSESTYVSHDASEENKNEFTSDDYDQDDMDNIRERRNPKTCVERELPNQFDDNNKPKQFSQNFQRNRHTRPQMLRQNHPYGMPGGPDFNQPFMPQFRGARRPPPGAQPDFMRGHSMPMMRGPPNHIQRMPPGMQPHPPRMPVGPGHLGPPHQRLQRPPFQGPQMFGNNPGMPPQGMIRPRGPPNQMMPQRPPFGPYSQPNHPPNMRLPMNPAMPSHSQPINPAIPTPSLPLPIIAPRKVLINPNFKGGVQAATNQLMMDTMKNSQNREAELLRQQEAFINQNRMHIEKRRRSRDHSPERDREYRDRDRERERNFSPPRRRERDDRKPYPSFRENRNRRADSRDREHPIDMKKKRNDSDGNPNDSKTEEDEETRTYRLQIEKQKAQREKILREKEMRRRKLAEEGLKKDDDKKVSDDQPQKLTPIIVTEKKIISLRKKPNEDPSDPPTQKIKSITLTRKAQTSSVSEMKGTGSQSKQIPRGGILTKKLRIDDDEFDEDELLADSPPSTPAPNNDATLKNRTNASKVGDIPTTMFTNRRIVVRNVDNVTNNENNQTNRPTTTGKGIFDRLDKKVIGVNEAAKRKIQRIVINNSD